MSRTMNPPASIARARRLRKGMTEGERRLWTRLRQFKADFGLHARKQAPIGNYVVDFAFHEIKLVVEVDGEHHQYPERQVQDRVRDEWLGSRGYRVLRLESGDVFENIEGCVERVLREAGVVTG